MQIFEMAHNQTVRNSLDLNDLLVKHPAATFFVRVAGNSSEEVGIFSGDILVVDRALKPTARKVVLAICDGEFVLRKCMSCEKGLSFVSIASQNKKEKSKLSSLEIQVFGVVTYVIKSLSE